MSSIVFSLVGVGIIALFMNPIAIFELVTLLIFSVRKKMEFQIL